MSEVKICNRKTQTTCDTMEQVACNPKTKIKYTTPVNLKTGDPMSDRPYLEIDRKHFVWINFCPFCGGDWETE